MLLGRCMSILRASSGRYTNLRFYRAWRTYSPIAHQTPGDTLSIAGYSRNETSSTGCQSLTKHCFGRKNYCPFPMSKLPPTSEAFLEPEPSPDSTPSPKPWCVELNHATSTYWWYFLLWHIPAIVSVTVSATLLWLNFTEFAIGGELGHSAKDSANVIGALQLVIKSHEILITASLIIIAQQLLLESLVLDGIVLGLLGAESALVRPSFIISGEYRQALAFGLRILGKGEIDRCGRPVQRRVLGLSLFFLLACGLSSLAGPASGVLIIPRVDWHIANETLYAPSNNTFPNIFIGRSDVFEIDTFYTPGLGYWEYYVKNSDWNATTSDSDINHKFGDIGAVAYINTTGRYNRSLSAEWSSGTQISCGMQGESGDIQGKAWGPADMTKISKGWRSTKTTVNVIALKALVTCRAREKIQCTPGNGSDLDWCYMGVDEHSAISHTKRTSRDLLLAADYGGLDLRVWITEGPHITANTHYSDSIEVIIEGPIAELESAFDLTVCSFSGALVSGIGTSYGIRFEISKIEYFNYTIRPNGDKAEPRKLLFHKTWLDRAHAVSGELWGNESYTTSDPFSYPARPRIVPPGKSNVLAAFGNATRDGLYGLLEPEAFPREVAVGGALAYLLSWVSTSYSQFTMPYDKIPPEFTAGLGPMESWPTTYKLSVHREGYIYRRSDRSGILGVVVLALHAVTVIVASLWQLIFVRRIIPGWKGTPQYAILGAGSPNFIEAYQSLSVDVNGDAMKRVITLRETPSDCGCTTHPRGELTLHVQARPSHV